MVKTTVYLDEADAAALRRLAASSGRSQAEIIRKAVADATAQVAKRKFRSMGIGHGGGEPIGQNADEIVRREMGRGSLPPR